MNSAHDEVLADLGQIFQRIEELTRKGYKRSAVRLAEEARRRALAHHLLIPYLHANFFVMNSAQALYDYRRGTDIAIETIALLESEEKARGIQSDLPLDEYEETIHWLTSCAYDNLAEHYAIRYGYGGARVQGVAQEGFDVCRRTGKLECFACFREYAKNVYEAAGDLEMAMHFARTTLQSVPMTETNDRRVIGGTSYANQLMLLGRLDEAAEIAESSLALAKSSYDPLAGRLLAQCCLGEILQLLGRADEFEERCAVLGEPVDWSSLPPPEENRVLAYRKALYDSVRLACQGALEEAEAVLTYWDSYLYRQQALGPWWEVRIRLIALHKMMDHHDTVKELSDILRKEGRQHQAWLHLKRLAVMERGDVPLSPVAFLCTPKTGIYAQPQSCQRASESQLTPGSDSTPSATIKHQEANEAEQSEGDQRRESGFDRSATPLAAKFEEWANRYAKNQSELEMTAILDEILAILPETVQVPEDAARLLFITGQMAEILGRELEMWTWARRFLDRFTENGDVLNLVATAGLAAVQARSRRIAEARTSRGRSKKALTRGKRRKHRGTLPTLHQLEEMFCKSLELSPNHPRHYLRAAQFYRFAGRHGETEWCLARSFALDRKNPVAALALADLYWEDDRDEDALAVLDLCLREGQVEDHEVAWNAGLAAFRLRRFSDAVTYFDHAEQWGCQEIWLLYYRAWALLELGRVEDATKDIQAFEAARGSPGLATHTLWACVAAHRGNIDELKQHVKKALAIPLQQIDDLSELGIEKNYHQMYHVARTSLPEDDEVLHDLVTWLYQVGLVPEELLDEERRKRPLTSDLGYYICAIHQPLDDAWPSHPACWENQKDWDAYTAYWGVLARNAEEAEHYAIQAQSRCYHLPPEALDVELEEEGFFDRPGVVFQGTRRHESDNIFSRLDEFIDNLDDEWDENGDSNDFESG
ncbi:MAG: hypothetical protein ACUVQG_03490 [Thermogutta sp.]